MKTWLAGHWQSAGALAFAAALTLATSAARAASGDAARTADTVASPATSPLADPEFARVYREALGGQPRESWLARLDGPGIGQKSVAVAGFDYVEMAFCKAQDCHDNNLVLLYSRDAGKVYGLVFEGHQRPTLIGQPPAAIASELRRLWQVEWRQGR